MLTDKMDVACDPSLAPFIEEYTSVKQMELKAL